MISYTWYVSCSPRSPEKIAPELTILSEFDGKPWNKVNQERFAMLLKELPSFEGSIYEKEPAFSARDRFAPMQTFGFAYVDSSGRLRITPAGWRLINGVRIQELFLKQFLKWQYPSWQHGGNRRTKHRYLPATKMKVFPFVETLKACCELEGLSKEEIAIFMLPILHKHYTINAIEKIKLFREEKDRLRGVERKRFIKKVHFEEYRGVYSTVLKSGEISTRESKTSTEEEFLKKKISNSLDVADAAIRYFRASGLFTLSADYRRLVISPLYRREVARILNEMTFEIVDYFDDVDRFYEYMGNPDIPALPWETKEELVRKVVSLGMTKERAKALSVIELKNFIEQEMVRTKEQKLKDYMVTAQEEDEVQDILETFDRILHKDVVDPPLFLEWNTWRAMVSINDCEKAKPNFVIDDDLRPFSKAPGNRADMEIEYNDTFVTLVEVTLSTGARQYDTEGEPVTRHIGKFQRQEKDKNNPRDVYGLFIAPKINPATRDYFFVHLKYINNTEFGGYLNIIPLTIAQFINIFRYVKSLQFFNRQIIKNLFDRIIALKDIVNNGTEWEERIPQVIEEWKGYWSQHMSA
jgi:hypothetical protein